MPVWRSGVPVYRTWTDWTRALLALGSGQRKTPGTYSRLLRKRTTGGSLKSLPSGIDRRVATRQKAESFRLELLSGGLK